MKNEAYAINDILPGGSLLQRSYHGSRKSLNLWHFAFNNGEMIELARFDNEYALDLALDHWRNRITRGILPTVIQDWEGNLYERIWMNLHSQARKK